MCCVCMCVQIDRQTKQKMCMFSVFIQGSMDVSKRLKFCIKAYFISGTGRVIKVHPSHWENPLTPPPAYIQWSINMIQGCSEKTRKMKICTKCGLSWHVRVRVCVRV